MLASMGEQDQTDTWYTIAGNARSWSTHAIPAPITMTSAESDGPRVRCEVTERGSRIVIPFGGEDHVVSVKRARELRDELIAALAGLEVCTGLVP